MLDIKGNLLNSRVASTENSKNYNPYLWCRVGWREDHLLPPGWEPDNPYTGISRPLGPVDGGPGFREASRSSTRRRNSQ